MRLADHPIIQRDLLDLARRDPLFAPYGFDIHAIPWKSFDPGFPGLVRIVLGQQVSTQAADGMWAKVLEAAGGAGKIQAGWILDQDTDSMKALGFSRQKSRYVRTLAENIQSGLFDAEGLEQQTDAGVIKAITDRLGFGLWSAQMYLIFCLQRPNILPQGDLAVDRAVQHLFDLKDRPDYDVLKDLTLPWAGRLTAASLLLWQIYGQ